MLDPDYAPAWIERTGGDIEAAVQEAVEKANANLSRPEQIKRWTLLEQDWNPGGDELTPTMKLKRRPIGEKYAAEIAAMYG